MGFGGLRWSQSEFRVKQYPPSGFSGMVNRWGNGVRTAPFPLLSSTGAPVRTKQEAAAFLVKIFLVFRTTLRLALLQISTYQWTCCSMFSCTFLLAYWGLIQSLLQIEGGFTYFFSGLWSTLWRQKYNCDRYMGEWTLRYHHISLWGDGKRDSAARPCASQSSKSNMNPT